MSLIERRYGIAGKAAGEAALMHGRDGARIRSCQDAFVLSRIARAVVDALDADDAGAVDLLRKIAADEGVVHDGIIDTDVPRRMAQAYLDALGGSSPMSVIGPYRVVKPDVEGSLWIEVQAQREGRWIVVARCSDEADAEMVASALNHRGAVAALERLANPTHRPRSEEAALLQAEVAQIAQATLDALGGQ